MKITRLEDLEVWQEARKLANMVYEATENFPQEEKYNLKKHLRECARSVMANIGEGFGRFHYQESIQFYRISRGSLGEIRSDIYLSLDRKYLSDEKLELIAVQNEIVWKRLNRLIGTTRQFKENAR